MKIKLILVHSGNNFPEYLNDCIELALIQNIEVHLILSYKLHKFIKYNIILVNLEEYQDENYLNYSNQKFDTTFRDNFWNRTSTRFFILHNYAKQKAFESFFHIENDVALFSNLQKEENTLSNTNKEMFLIMDSHNRCIPSLLWVRNYKILESLSNHIYLNQDKNDMESLASFFYYHQNTVGNLPIIPSFYLGELKDSQLDYSNLFDELNCIFDGASIGQYLFGIDCIENPNKNTKGFINETCTFNPNNFKYEINKTNLYLNYKELKVPIINLHMHCKNLKQLL